MRSTELHFPLDITDLSLDCKDLCQKLLRRNPGISDDVCVCEIPSRPKSKQAISDAEVCMLFNN